jgi:hypothetical protein
MSFSSGTVSMRRFSVLGSQPKSIDQSHLDALEKHKINPQDSGSVEIDYGWTAGRHVFDTQFSFEHNVFNDALSFALRVDTNRVPAEIRAAFKIMEEDALAAPNPSGFISNKQKKTVRETLSQKIDDELRTGKYRRSKLTPILWDFPTSTLYTSATSSAAEKLMELFERTFGLELQPLSAGSLALNLLKSQAHRRDYEDLRPTRFVLADGGDSHYPDYPWAAKGPQPKDFLGNEFLLWLWHEADRNQGVIKTDPAEITLFIDKLLDLDCAYGQSGRDTLRSAGPAQMPEALDALRSAKVPRKLGLILDTGQQFSLTLSAEPLSVSTARLPEVEDAETPRVLFEERIMLLRDLWRAIDHLFATFLKNRTTSHWESQTNTIRKWILTPSPRPTAPRREALPEPAAV